jgi:hypothetical protein
MKKSSSCVLKETISRYFIFKPERAVGVAVVGKAAGV